MSKFSWMNAARSSSEHQTLQCCSLGILNHADTVKVTVVWVSRVKLNFRNYGMGSFRTAEWACEKDGLAWSSLCCIVLCAAGTDLLWSGWC